MIAELVEIGELDDERFALAFAEDKRELSGWGGQRIAAALAGTRDRPRRSPNAPAAEPREVELERAVELVCRRERTSTDERARARACRFLARRGYEYETHMKRSDAPADLIRERPDRVPAPAATHYHRPGDGAPGQEKTRKPGPAAEPPLSAAEPARSGRAPPGRASADQDAGSSTAADLRARREEIARLQERALHDAEAARLKLAEIERREHALADRERNLEGRAEELKRQKRVQRKELERLSGLTAAQAKQMLIADVEHDARRQAGRVLLQIDEETKRDADRRARNILSIAMGRLAGAHVERDHDQADRAPERGGDAFVPLATTKAGTQMPCTK